jgi:hypothetical protein
MNYTYKSKTFKVINSPRKNKQKRAIFKDGVKIDFGDPSMKEYPGTKRGDRYCIRSSGLGNVNKLKSANFLSRKILWNCKGKKSMKTLKASGIKTR